MTNNVSSKPSSSLRYVKEIMSPEVRLATAKDLLNSYQQLLEETPPDLKRREQTDSILEYAFLKTEEKRKLQKSNSTNNVKSFYEKEMERKKQHNQKMEEKRNRKRLYELDNLWPFPKVNDKSRLLLQERSTRSANNKSSHLRISEEKKKNMQSNLINQINQEANNKDKKRTYNPEVFNEWVEMNEVWKQQKEAKLAYMRGDIYKMVANEEKSAFAPKINKTSEMLAEIKNINEHPGMSTVERLYQAAEEQVKKVASKKLLYTPSFMPIVNKGYKFNVASRMKQKKKTYVYEMQEDPAILSPERNPRKNYSQDTKCKMKMKSSEKEEKRYIDDGSLYLLNVRNNLSWNLPDSSVKMNNRRTKALVRNLPQYWK